MNMIPCLNTDKEALQEVMEREVALMRCLLTSLLDECNAIRMQDSHMFDNVMEERIDLIGSFEQWSEKLISLTIKLAKGAEVPVRGPRHLRHSEAIEVLQECLDPDDFELLSLRDQLSAIIDEIYLQNDINASLIKDGVPGEWLAAMQPRAVEMQKPKCIVTVIEK